MTYPYAGDRAVCGRSTPVQSCMDPDKCSREKQKRGSIPLSYFTASRTRNPRSIRSAVSNMVFIVHRSCKIAANSCIPVGSAQGCGICRGHEEVLICRFHGCRNPRTPRGSRRDRGRPPQNTSRRGGRLYPRHNLDRNPQEFGISSDQRDRLPVSVINGNRDPAPRLSGVP